MSDTQTHSRGTDSPLNLITGEPPGIKELLASRAAGETTEAPAAPVETRQPDTDAETRAAQEVAALRRQATDADARAAEAEHGRRVAESQRNAALQGAEDTGFTAITTALAAATRERESLATELKTAGEAGDFGRVAEISGKLGELSAEIRDLSQGKHQFEQDRNTRLQQPRAVEQPRIEASSATERQILAGLRAPSKEAFLASRTSETRAFLTQHPEFFSDPAAHQRMIGAESLARGQGHVVDSEAYFNAIRETALGQTMQPRQPTERAITPGAAPTRQAPATSGRANANGDVVVSREQKIAAEWMGVDPVEYAKEENELRARGELPYRRR